MGQDSADGSPHGAARQHHDRSRPAEEGDDPWSQQSVPEEERSPELCEGDPGHQDLRIRDHSTTSGRSHEVNHDVGAKSELRRVGFWHACQQDLHPSGHGVSAVPGLVPEDLQRGTGELEDGEVHQVGYCLEPKECRRPVFNHSGLHEQFREGDDQGQGQGQESSGDGYRQRDRFVFYHGPCGSFRLGRRGRNGDRGGLGSQGSGGSDPRTSSSSGPCHQEQVPQEGDVDQRLSGYTQNSNFEFSPPAVRDLGTKSLKKIYQEFCGFLSREWHDLVFNDRLVLLEICCSPESELVNQCQKKFGKHSAERLSHWNGGDLETPQGVKLAKEIITEKRPRLVWLSPECGPYSPMQHLNCRNPEQKQNLESKRERVRKQYAGVEEIAEHVDSLGLTFMIELSERCEAWTLPWFQKLQSKVSLHSGV